MAVMYLVDGIPLIDPAKRWWLDHQTSRRALPAIRSTSITTPQRHGATFSPGDPLEVTTMGISIVVTDRDADGIPGGVAQVEANMEYLTALLVNPSKLLRIEQRTAPGETRVAYGTVAVGSEPQPQGSRLLQYLMQFVVRIPGVFWSDGAGPQVAMDPAPTATGLINLSNLHGGSAPITDATVSLLGPFNGKASVTDPVSGTGLSWQGTVPAGTYLFLDAKSLRAWTSPSSGAWFSGTDVSSGLDYPPVGPLQLMPVATTAGTTYSLAFALPAANPAADAVRVRAERKFL